jgi:signal peptidase I
LAYFVCAVLSLLAPGTFHLVSGRVRAGSVYVLLYLGIVVLDKYFLSETFVGLIGGWVAEFLLGTVAMIHGMVTIRKGQRRWSWKLALVCLLGGVAFFMVPWNQLGGYLYFAVSGKNMYPSIQEGDHIVLSTQRTAVESPHLGDIVAVRFIDSVRIYRIAAVGGQTIQFSGGRLLVDGVEAGTSRFYFDRERAAEIAAASAASSEKGESSTSDHFGPVTVAPAKVFVIGENWYNSLDSREFGPVPLHDIVGVARYVSYSVRDWRRMGIPLGQ